MRFILICDTFRYNNSVLQVWRLDDNSYHLMPERSTPPLTGMSRTGAPPHPRLATMRNPEASANNLSAEAARAKRRHQTYSRFVHWVRKTHGWIGLWGALLGLVFGLSGIWLNHRAVLKLPLNQQKSHAQMALADPPPSTPEAMGQWLAPALGFSGPPNSVRIDPAKALPWAEKGATQATFRANRSAGYSTSVARTRPCRLNTGRETVRSASTPHSTASSLR